MGQIVWENYIAELPLKDNPLLRAPLTKGHMGRLAASFIFKILL